MQNQTNVKLNFGPPQGGADRATNNNTNTNDTASNNNTNNNNNPPMYRLYAEHTNHHNNLHRPDPDGVVLPLHYANSPQVVGGGLGDTTPDGIPMQITCVPHGDECSVLEDGSTYLDWWKEENQRANRLLNRQDKSHKNSKPKNRVTANAAATAANSGPPVIDESVPIELPQRIEQSSHVRQLESSSSSSSSSSSEEDTFAAEEEDEEGEEEKTPPSQTNTPGTAQSQTRLYYPTPPDKRSDDNEVNSHPDPPAADSIIDNLKLPSLAHSNNSQHQHQQNLNLTNSGQVAALASDLNAQAYSNEDIEAIIAALTSSESHLNFNANEENENNITPEEGENNQATEIGNNREPPLEKDEDGRDDLGAVIGSEHAPHVQTRLPNTDVETVISELTLDRDLRTQRGLSLQSLPPEPSCRAATSPYNNMPHHHEQVANMVITETSEQESSHDHSHSQRTGEDSLPISITQEQRLAQLQAARNHAAATGGAAASQNTPTISTSNADRAKFISATLLKPTKRTNLGLGFRTHPDTGVIEIADINPEGFVFVAGAPLRVGDQLLSIRTTKGSYFCGTQVGGITLQEVAKLLKKTTGSLTLVVQNPQGNPNWVESMTSKPNPKFGTGIFFVSGAIEWTALQIHSVPSNGLFANSLLHRDDQVLRINGLDCSALDACVATDIVKAAPRYVSIVAQTTTAHLMSVLSKGSISGNNSNHNHNLNNISAIPSSPNRSNHQQATSNSNVSAHNHTQSNSNNTISNRNAAATPTPGSPNPGQSPQRPRPFGLFRRTRS